MLRDFTCDQLNHDHIGKKVRLSGWIQKTRNLGQLLFVDLRDKHGITQLNFSNYKLPINMADLSLESVIGVEGIVFGRPLEAQNPKMQTGMIEIMVNTLEIYSTAKIPPFLPCSTVMATEDLRLRYRYLDLRSTRLQDMLKIRSDLMMKVRTFFHAKNFIEVETPVLYKSTPEGARDFLVPSRLHKGQVYALPQSPQILKQLLMIGGTDRYFQICKCFRDEAFRSDRQPEFTQIDLEMSFVEESDLKKLITELIKIVFSRPEDFSIPVMTYQQAMDDYGCDKPDVRFDLKHLTITKLIQQWDFPKLKEFPLVKAIFLPARIGTLTRKDLDAMKDIFWFKYESRNFSGGVSKFIPDTTEQSQFFSQFNEDGIWLLIASKSISLTHQNADILRRDLANKFQLIKHDDYKFLWVTDFPLLDWDEEAKRFVAMHHPFTRPQQEDESIFFGTDQDKEKIKQIKAIAYDLVCNGVEIGGGSLRIFHPKMQERMFELLGFSKEEQNYQFGHFVTALEFGTPPHGGMALGLDRIVMMLTGIDQIREVIAFPKSSSGVDLMSQAPSKPTEDQVNELHFRFLS